MSFLLRLSLAFCFSLLLVGSASAQILNIEKVRVSRDSSNYFTGKVGLSLNTFSQADDEEGRETKTDQYTSITGTGTIGYVSEENSYMLLASYNFLRLQGNTEAETGYIHGRVTFKRKNLVSYETYAQLQYDLARGLQPRALVGVGVRFSVVRSDNLALHLGTGVMYEYERWFNSITDTYVKKNIPKLSNYVSVKLPLNSHLDLNTIHYYQVGYDQKSGIFRHRVSGDISFNIKVTNRLQLMTNFSHTYEASPIVPVPKYLYSLTNGLQLNF